MIERGKVYVDDRVGTTPRWRLGGDESELMRVPEEITKCVAFLAAKANSEPNYHYGGTAFFVSAGAPTAPGQMYVFLVTARHNVRNAKAAGRKLYLRLNLKSKGSVMIEVTDPWLFPDTDAADIAVTPMSLGTPNTLDIVLFPEAGFASDEILAAHQIGIGDELMISGLFAYHRGTERNLPIVRSGIIASMPQEPLVDENSGLPYDAYLAEVRSIGGLSGSPVFVVIAPGRVLGESVRIGTRHFFLLGLIRGHWNKPDETADGFLGNSERESINTGIAIVTPIQELLNILRREEVVDEMKKADREAEKKNAPTEDSTLEDETEYERFEDLARKLVSVPKAEIDEKRKDES